MSCFKLKSLVLFMKILIGLVLSKNFIKIIMKKVTKHIFLKFMLNILKNYITFTIIYHFYLQELNLKNVERLVANLYVKKHMSFTQQISNHGLVLKKVLRVIRFIQIVWLKPFIDMNTKVRKKAKRYFEKDFFKLMNNSVFGMELWKM